MKNTIQVDGVTYRREQANGNRYVVVLDRGWIFAGDLTENNGRILLERAVNLRHASSVGFDGALANPSSDKVTLKAMPTPVDLPADTELFRCPVADQWGL